MIIAIAHNEHLFFSNTKKLKNPMNEMGFVVFFLNASNPHDKLN